VKKRLTREVKDPALSTAPKKSLDFERGERKYEGRKSCLRGSPNKVTGKELRELERWKRPKQKC